MRDFKEFSREEKRIEIVKYLQEPHTRTEVTEHFDIDPKSLYNYFVDDNSIDILDMHIPIYFEKHKYHKITIEGSKEGKSTIHPINLALNLTEINLLVDGMLKILNSTSIEYRVYKNIAERIYAQLTPYAKSVIGNEHVLSENADNRYYSVQELIDKFHESKILFADKGVTIKKQLKVYIKEGANIEEYKGYVDIKNNVHVLTDRNGIVIKKLDRCSIIKIEEI